MQAQPPAPRDLEPTQGGAVCVCVCVCVCVFVCVCIHIRPVESTLCAYQGHILMSVIGLVQLTTTDCAGSGEDLSTCREHILLSVIGLVQLTTTNKVSGQNDRFSSTKYY